MKRVFLYAGTLLFTFLRVIPLLAQNGAPPAIPGAASLRLPPPKVQQLVWQVPAARSFTPRDLVLTTSQLRESVQFEWWKDLNRLYEVSPASKALALGLAVGTAFTPFNNYLNAPSNVQENTIRYYRQNSLYTGKQLPPTWQDAYQRVDW